MALSEEDVQEVTRWASKHLVIEKVYLFGSRARGDYRPESDIDLAVQMPENNWFDWHPNFERCPDLSLPYDIHLQWYSPKSLKIVGSAVERDGICLYDRSRAGSSAVLK